MQINKEVLRFVCISDTHTLHESINIPHGNFRNSFFSVQK